MIRIDIDDDQINAALARIGDLTPFIQEAGEMLVQSTQDRMAAGLAPEGAASAPRSQFTLDH
jgi:hypothetical protein